MGLDQRPEAVSLRSGARKVRHPRRRVWAFAVGALALGGCDSSDYEGPLEVGLCTVLDAEKISGDAAPLGFTAREAAARYPVTEHSLTFEGFGRWNTPPATDVEVGILSADLSRLYWVKKAESGPVAIVGPVDSIPDPCPPALTFPVTVRFRSADGMFDEELRTEVWATAEEISWSTCLPIEKLRGQYVPQTSPHFGPSFVPHEFCFRGETSPDSIRGSVNVFYKDLQNPGYNAILAYYGFFWSWNPPESLEP